MPLETYRDGAPNPNRFDALWSHYSVLYFGTDLRSCFGETLARFRPDPALLAVVEDDWREKGFMDVGAVPADWRHRRTAVHVVLPENSVFLDVESPVTHQVLRRVLASELATLEVQDLDVSTVRGPDRRVTQMISEWAYRATDDGNQRYVGIRYLSRLNSDWECWALFDDEELEITVVEAMPLTTDMSELVEVANLFGLTVH